MDFVLQNQILWIDENNLTACIEAGIIGQDLERKVRNALNAFVCEEVSKVQYLEWYERIRCCFKKNTSRG